MTDSMKTAVVTAILTGVFTVIAGVATYWFTNKEPELSYSVAGGPALSSDSGAKRIFVVEVRNAGKKEVVQTLIQIDLKDGDLNEAASEASPGVKVVEEKTPHRINISADVLNQGDVVKVSFLASLISRDADPVVTVRAPGVKAVAEATKIDHAFDLTQSKRLLPLLLAALAAVLSTFFIVARIGVFGRLTSFSSSGLDQCELAAYICAECGLYEEADQLRFGGGEISYRGAGDFLRQKAQRLSASQRQRYETALRTLLLVPRLAPNSLISIRSAVDSIAAIPMTDVEIETMRNNIVVENDDPINWRQRVNSYIRERELIVLIAGQS